VLHVCVQKGARNAELFANKVENTKTQMREAMIANGGAMSRKGIIYILATLSTILQIRRLLNISLVRLSDHYSNMRY